MFTFETVKFITRLIDLGVGFPLFISGVVGNLLNIRLFWANHRNSCAFLLMCSSISNCVVLVCGLLNTILLDGLDIDWSQGSHLWCKCRLALNQTFWLISLSCLCLAAIERYLISSRNEKYRRFSHISLARLAIIFLVLVWSCHAIPYAIFSELIEQRMPNNMTTWMCLFTPNSIFTHYRIYFSLPFLFCIVPCTLLSIMGYLTYRNISSLRSVKGRQSAQTHLTKLLLVQTPLVILPSSPFVILMIYAEITSTNIKSQEQIAIENLSSTVSMVFFYITYSWSFFIFFFSSKTFRQDVHLIFTGHCRLPQHVNRVFTVPVQTTSGTLK